MSTTSSVLGLPYIQQAQAQKHVTHNEALRILDKIVQLAVVDRTLATPPAAPVAGESYIVAAAGTGDWAGHDNDIAVWDNPGWVFVTPQAGWRAQVLAEDGQVVFDAVNGWQAPGLAASTTDMLGINTTADTTNRLAVASDATLLTHDGADHQLKINKATAPDTSSLLFQTGFSGRAEMGTMGDDDFGVKVSPDGTTWAQAIKVDQATGYTEMSRLSSQLLTLDQDTVGIVPTPGAGGFVMITNAHSTYPQSTHAGIFVYDTGASLGLTPLVHGPGIDPLGTTTLTGTTGGVGQSSLAVINGAIVIENRFNYAADRTYSLTFIGGL